MFFLQFEVTPHASNPEGNSTAGAYVNCWIETSTLADAIEIAQTQIRDLGWIVDDPDEAYPIDASDYDDKPEGREYFEQALVDKTVFVFHEFPVDERDQELDP